MSIFEFLTVAVSIVLALGLGRLISCAPYVFDVQKSDWLHGTFYVLLVVAHIVVWWRVWLLNDVSSWNILQFAILMGSPLSLYLASTALVSNAPEQVTDWKAYLADRSRWIFVAVTAVVFFGLLRSYFIRGVTPEWWSFLAVAIYAGAALNKRRIMHVVVVLLTFLYVGALLSRDFTAT
jgi:hypothetical protein